MRQMKVTTMQAELPCLRCKAPTREKARQRVGSTHRHIEAPLCPACQRKVPGVRIVRAA
jgi:hypothetical protein